MNEFTNQIIRVQVDNKAACRSKKVIETLSQR